MGIVANAILTTIAILIILGGMLFLIFLIIEWWRNDRPNRG